MIILEKWVDNFSRWPEFGQAVFIIVMLSMILGFITVMVRGYPKYGQDGNSSST